MHKHQLKPAEPKHTPTLYRRIIARCSNPKCSMQWTTIPSVAKSAEHKGMQARWWYWDCACGTGLAAIEIAGRILTESEAMIEFLRRGVQ